MKKIYSVVAATGLAIALSGCGNNASTPSTMDKQSEKTLCDVKANGIEAVLDMAVKHNAIAKEHGVEFKRLGMTNTQYIDATQKALKAGEKEIVLLDAKGKPTKNSVSVEYAAQRACKFAISALTQEAEGKSTWRAAVPGCL
jgi:uncharacterized lipoprotein YehR (DUF1307 family)